MSSGDGISADTADVIATDNDAGQRLDKVLATHLQQFSRARLQDLIRTGCVTSGAKTIIDTKTAVKAGDVFTISVPPPEPAEPEPENITLNVVYEDKDVIVIDKPAGLVVHPAAGHSSGTLVNALLAHCGATLSGIGGVKRPGIVHRLDKDTSGLLVVAKNDQAHAALSAQFQSHGLDGRMQRAYLALVWGAPERPQGTIELSLSRSSTNRKKITVTRGDAGRHAVTHYTVLERYSTANRKNAASLLRLELETGRTHQIRVHLAHTGHPVLGDPVYGSGFKASAKLLPEPLAGLVTKLNRQALHAAELGFEHPQTGKPLYFCSKLPPELSEIIERFQSL